METLAELAVRRDPVDDVLARTAQAPGRAGRHSRSRHGPMTTSRPPSRSSNRPRIPRGDEASSSCPQPDEGDVFLDFEGDPFWRADVGSLLPLRPHRP